MQAHPLIPPLIAPGGWPQATDDEKKAALAQLKQTRWINAGMESCVTKGILAGVAGFGFGMLFSLFTWGMAYDSPFGRSLDNKTLDWRKGLKDAGMSAVRQGRSFGAVGASYAVFECIIESYRGKHDMTSAITGGFAAGAFLARNGGHRAMVLSGATFAGFSYGIERFWIRAPASDDDAGFFVC